MILAESSIKIEYVKPVPELIEYVKNIWMLRNTSDTEHEIIVLPDRKLNVSFSYFYKQPYHVMLMGLGTKPEPTVISPGVVIFTVKPQNQQKVIDVLVEAGEQTMNQLPGFISSNLHRSFDGKYVVNYAQWRSREDFEAMLHNPLALPHIDAAAALSESYNPILSEVSDVMEAVTIGEKAV